MAIRIQIRRDTAANWTSANPVLRAGEFGVETDTLKFKIGNGTSTWTQITSYANVTPTGLSNSLGDYILSADQGNAGGPAELDSNGDLIVPQNSVILWNDDAHTYTTTLTATQPTADRTITFPNNSGTVITTGNLHNITEFGVLVSPIVMEGSTANDFELTISAGDPTADRTITFPDVTGTVVTTGDAATVTNTMLAGSIANDKLTNSAITINGTSTSLGGSRTLGTDDVSEGSTNKYFTDERAQDAIGNSVGTGLSYNDTTGAISVDTSAIQARVTNVTDTEIGYLDGVTSAIQTQLNDKLASATASTTYAPIASPTFTGTVTLPGAPTSDLHAATKAYVDAATSGLNVHDSVKAATTENVNLNNQLEAGDTLDGVTLAHNDRVLVKNQNTASQNGIYIVQPNGAATRATDYDSAPEVDAGDFMFVEGGTVNGKTGWIQTNFITTVGTDAIAFAQFSGAGTYLAGTGLTLTGNSFSINTGTTVDLSTAQALTNKTINATSNTITVTSANVSDFNEAAQDAVGTILSGDLAYNDSTPGIALNYVTVGNTLLDGVSGSSYGLIGTSTYLDVKNTNGYNKEIELDIAAVKTQLNTDGYLTTSSTSTLTNKTLTSPKINENVALTATATELNYVVGVTSAIQTQLDARVAKSLVDAKGDILVGSADNTVSRLGVGTNGYLLTANSSATNGIEWAAAPISLPTQTSNSGKYLTTDGTDASWAAIPVTSAATTSARGTVYGSTGAYQTILGYQALGGGTFSGAYSTVVMGYQAGYNLGAGEKNVIVGGFAATANSSGSYNTILGTESAKNTSGGSNNVLLGYQSGYDLSNGSNNILIGSGAQASTSTTSNEIAIGNANITRFRIPGIGLDFGKSTTVTANTATTVDTVPLASFTSMEYMVSLKQGTKVRTSKVIVQNNGSSVDMTEFAITETGGVISGVAISAGVSGTDGVLQATITDATSTNVTVKLSKVAL
jgi:hypothetical protein